MTECRKKKLTVALNLRSDLSATIAKLATITHFDFIKYVHSQKQRFIYKEFV